MGPGRDRRPRRRPSRALTLLAVAACLSGGEATTAQAPGVTGVTAAVVRVVDGDSLVALVGGIEVDVRLAGINAPEWDECHGDTARLELARLAGPSIALEVVDEDRFGRTVAGVWSGETFVNEALASAGAALALSEPGPWTDGLVALETEARRGGRGMWAAGACGEDLGLAVRLEMDGTDPRGPDEEALDDEFVTVANDGAVALDLSGFVVRDESTAHRLTLPPGTVIEPMGTIRVTSGCPPPPEVGWCEGTPIWNNAGDSALLLSPSGTVVAHARRR